VSDQESRVGKYPLLQALLEERGLSLKGTYTYHDTTEIFKCSIRSLQDRIRSGELQKRNLPGRAKFLSVDLENFLENSLEKAPKRRNANK